MSDYIVENCSDAMLLYIAVYVSKCNEVRTWIKNNVLAEISIFIMHYIKTLCFVLAI